VIGLDTNILIRYFTQDDPRLSPVANLIIHGLSESSPGFISLVTLAETIWVLDRTYGLAREELVRILNGLLETATFRIQNELQVFAAMAVFESGTAGFSDALVGTLDTWAGCSHTVTFDRKAARLPGFQLA
jgi:predicted nucleic-acid-binding protein